MSRAAEVQSADMDGSVQDAEALVNADLQLSEIVQRMEETEWKAVPTISAPEAAALTKRLIEARDASREQAEREGDR